MTLDMTESIAPRSDQMNADDLMSGPRTFTIKDVRKSSSAEQPFDFYLAEFPADRPFKPSKSMRRVMVLAWGNDAATYAGKRLTLYRDPAVRFGGQDVGGVRISHMSDLKKPLTVALTVSKGKRAPYVVQPLADEPKPVNTSDEVTSTQLKEINDGLTSLGISDRDVKLATVCQVIDREIESAKHLTRAEAVTVLDWIKAQDTEPALPATSTDPADGWPTPATIPGTGQ